MAHKIVTFRLHVRGVALLVIGCVLLAVLIFAVGFLAGMRFRPPDVTKPSLPAGVSARAVALPAVAPPATDPNAPKLALRVATFDSEDAAKASVQDLASRYKLEGTIVPEAAATGTVYCVLVGRYASRQEAADAAAALQREHELSAVVVPAP